MVNRYFVKLYLPTGKTGKQPAFSWTEVTFDEFMREAVKVQERISGGCSWFFEGRCFDGGKLCPFMWPSAISCAIAKTHKGPLYGVWSRRDKSGEPHEST